MSARAENLRQGTLDLLGQITHGCVAGGARTQPVVRRLTDRAAVTALDLTEPTNQVHASAYVAPVKVVCPVHRRLAVRTDQNLPVFAHATAPRTLASVRVRLSGTAPITGHSACPDSAVA